MLTQAYVNTGKSLDKWDRNGGIVGHVLYLVLYFIIILSFIITLLEINQCFTYD